MSLIISLKSVRMRKARIQTSMVAITDMAMVAITADENQDELLPCQGQCELQDDEVSRHADKGNTALNVAGPGVGPRLPESILFC